jgi:hypothetical protein
VGGGDGGGEGAGGGECGGCSASSDMSLLRAVVGGRSAESNGGWLCVEGWSMRTSGSSDMSLLGGAGGG